MRGFLGDACVSGTWERPFCVCTVDRWTSVPFIPQMLFSSASISLGVSVNSLTLSRVTIPSSED